MAAVTSSPRPKTPGLVYGALSLAMLVLISLVALTARQPPPPSIAEFAPQAVDQIKEAPSEQSSAFGSGDGGSGEGAAGGATTTTTTTAPPPPSAGPPVVIDKARVRRCVGNPPRQIEDPQSPPCVAFWDDSKGNGGATSKGVSANEIRIGVPNWIPDYHPLLERFFNNRFELYGRQLRLINLNGPDPGADQVRQQTDAQTADTEHKIFASTDYSADTGLFYNAELARRQIISAAVQPANPEPYLRDKDPYLWSYPTGVDVMFANIGEWVCKRLAPRNASYAGNVQLRQQKRVFGIAMQWYSPDIPTDSKPLVEELRRCGVTVAAQVETQYSFGDQQRALTTIQQMQEAGVTSVICLCQVTSLGDLGKQANNRGYFPEWLASTYLLQDYDWAMKAFVPANQLSATFGLSFLPRQVRAEDRPSVHAAKEIDPGFSTAGTVGTLAFPKVQAMDDAYHSLLLLASGIQMAGPKLTPETFARALQRTVFPNPDSPTQPGKVGFANDHSMEEDAVEWWWSNAARSPIPGGTPGALCYVDGATRHKKGQWPTAEPPFFAGTCDSG